MKPDTKIAKAPAGARCSCQVPATTRMQVDGVWQTVPTPIKCQYAATMVVDGVLMCPRHFAKLKETTQ